MQMETQLLPRAVCRCAALLRSPFSSGTPRSVPVLSPETTPCVPSQHCLGNTAFEMHTPGSRLHRPGRMCTHPRVSCGAVDTSLACLPDTVPFVSPVAG